MSATGSSGPQVTHPDETATTVAATRSLIAAQRTADAPVDVLERAAALVDEAPDCSRPIRSTASRARTRSACRSPAASSSPPAIRPASSRTARSSARSTRSRPPVVFTFDGERMQRARHPRRALHRAARHRARRRRGDGARRAARRGERVPRSRCVHRHAHHPLRTTDADRRGARPSTRWVDRTEGRKVFTVGTISAGGEVTARADGVFIRVDPGAWRDRRSCERHWPTTGSPGASCRPAPSSGCSCSHRTSTTRRWAPGTCCSRTRASTVCTVFAGPPDRYPDEADRVGRARRVPAPATTSSPSGATRTSPRSRCSAPSTAGWTSSTTSTSSPTIARPPTTIAARDRGGRSTRCADRGRAPARARQPRPRRHPRRRRAGRAAAPRPRRGSATRTPATSTSRACWRGGCRSSSAPTSGRRR